MKMGQRGGQPENTHLSPAQVSKALCIVLSNVVLKFTFQFWILKKYVGIKLTTISGEIYPELNWLKNEKLLREWTDIKSKKGGK